MLASHLVTSLSPIRPLVFWGVIGTLIALSLGLTLALISIRPRGQGRIREIWTRWTTMAQELHEDNPRQSLNLPIQAPPPLPPPQPSPPIPIPTHNPSLRSFDTFDEALRPLRIYNLRQFRRQASQLTGPGTGPGYV